MRKRKEPLSPPFAVLTAATLIYLAAAITSILQPLYYISIANRRS